MEESITKQFIKRDIKDIDLANTFFHYTNKNNLDNISKLGLESRIGENSLHVEKSKKVFFQRILREF